MDVARLKRGDQTVIIGTSGFAVELAGLLKDSEILVHGCIGPDPPAGEQMRYLGDDSCISDWIHLTVLVALGQPELRRRLFERILLERGSIGTFIHRQAYVSSAAVIGEGVIVYPHATVHAAVVLDEGVLVNSNATIGHETRVGAFTTVAPGAQLGGKIRIGREVYVGIGATIKEEITVADGTVLGAGAVVVANCDVPGTYVGVPARVRSA
jgi:sugar O-acyltransferase (sialic acid O-acetyltransferase NeuD family)